MPIQIDPGGRRLRDRPDPANEVAAFLAGDSHVLIEIRRGIRAVVVGFHFAGSVEEDLVQESIFRVFASLRSGSFRGEASLRTFGQRIAEYTCLEHIRRIRNHAEVDASRIPEASSMNGPEGLFLRAEKHQEDLRKLAQMPPECRALFRMIFIERLSYAEVARRCGISEAAVKLRVYRCRLTVRDGRPSERDGRVPSGAIVPRLRRSEAGE